MAFKEYKDYSKEFNDVGNEFKRIDAEFASPREMATPPDENLDVPEESSQVKDDSGIDRNDLNQDRLNQNSNSDSSDSSSGAAGGAVVASTAALTGGVTILSACAIVAATVGVSIMNKTPKILSHNIEAGADYLLYEIDIDELTEGTNYKIKIYNSNNLIIDYPIETNGMQRQLVTGLTPFRKYNVAVVAETDDFGDIEYYNYECYTSKFKKPRAIIEFVPRIKYDAQGKFERYDLAYDAYISDYYKTGFNTYLEIYKGIGNDKRLIVDDHDLPEDNFFRGVLENIGDGVTFSAEVWTTYYDDLTLIGSIGEYKTKYPADAAFLSSYEFDEQVFSSSLANSDGKHTLNINTNFDNSNHDDEAYKIALYNNGEKIAESGRTTDKELEFELPEYVSYVDVVFTGLRDTEDGEKEIVEQKLKYVLEPRLFDLEYRFFEDSYYLELRSNREIFDEETQFNLEFKYHMTNGDVVDISNEIDFEYGSYESEVGEMPDGYSLKDLDYIELNIKNENGVYVGKYNLPYNVVKLSVSDFEITDDGNVKFSYQFETDDVKFRGASPQLDGIADYFELGEDQMEGTLTFTRVSDNIISGGFFAYYIDTNGIETEAFVPLQYKDNNGNISNSINLNAEIYATTYITYQDSNLCGHVKFEAIADNKHLNMVYNLDKYVKNDFTDEYQYTYVETSGYADGQYYSLDAIQDFDGYDPTEKYFQYKLTFNGFDYIISDGKKYYFEEDPISSDESKFVVVKNGVDIGTISNDYADYGSKLYMYYLDLHRYEDGEAVDYVKTTNEDGTVNYYFYTNFYQDDDYKDTIYEIIRFSYLDENNIRRYLETDYVNGKYIAIENIADYDYDFNYELYYYGTDSLTGDKNYYLVKDYKCKEITAEAVANLNHADINANKDLNYVTIELNMDNNSIGGENLTLNFNNKDYVVDFSQPSYGNDEYSYNVSTGDDIRMISLTIFGTDDVTYKDLLASITKYQPTIKFTCAPAIVANIGVSNIKNGDKLTREEELPIFEYTGQYDLADLKYNVYVDEYGMGTHIDASFGSLNDEFSATDERDSIKVYVYSGDELIAEGEESWGDSHSYYRFDHVAAIYKQFTIKIYEIKKASEIIQYNLIAEKDFDLTEDYESSKDVNYQIQSDGESYSINLRVIDDSSNYSSNYYSYRLNVYELVDGRYQLVAENINEMDTLINYEGDHIPDAVRFDVIRSTGYTDVLCRRIDYSFNVGESSGYTLEDDLTTINIPWTINVPEGLELSYSDSKIMVNGNEITIPNGETSGYAQIDELESNIVEVSFYLMFTDSNGGTYSYIQTVNNKLEYQLDFDYEIVNMARQSSAYAYYKVYYGADGTQYWNWGNRVDNSEPQYLAVCDKDGNVVDDTSTLELHYHGASYYIDGKVIGRIGNHTFDCDDSYTIRVVTAGDGPVENQNYNPGIATSQTELSNEDLSNNVLKLLFYMSETGNTYVNDDDHGYTYYEVSGTISFTIVDSLGNEKDINITINEPEHINEEDFNFASLFPNYGTYDGSSVSVDDYGLRDEINENITYNESNDTIHIEYDTGFDVTANPTYSYVVTLYDVYTDELVYKSDYLTTSAFSLDVPNRSLFVEITAYYYEDGVGYVQTKYSKKITNDDRAINCALARSSMSEDGDGYEAEFALRSFSFDGSTYSVPFFDTTDHIYVIIDDVEYDMGVIADIKDNGTVTLATGITAVFDAWNTVTVRTADQSASTIKIRLMIGTEGNYREATYTVKA